MHSTEMFSAPDVSDGLAAPFAVAQREVDLHQGVDGNNARMVEQAKALNPSTDVAMPPLHKFKRFDVRPLIKQGSDTLPQIEKRVAHLKPDQGLIVVAPYLPSPLIEKLGGEGFASKIEHMQGSSWFVYFWRENAA